MNNQLFYLYNQGLGKIFSVINMHGGWNDHRVLWYNFVRMFLQKQVKELFFA